MFKRRSVQIILAVLLILVVVALAGPRVDLDTTLRPITLDENLDAYVMAQEAQFDDIVDGSEATIVWANDDKSRTEYSIVYLHGFSASRQETAPLSDNVAQQLGANLYYPRLTGHGRDGQAMADATVNDWVNDTNEAVEIGRKLGEKVILIGTSTGGTLAAWAAENVAANIAAIIFISPNFAVNGGGTDLFLLPWGEQMLTAVMGEERSWQPVNDAHARYWTEQYPIAGLLPMGGTVNIVADIDKSAQTIPALFIYSPNDTVIDPAEVEAVYAEWGSSDKQLYSIDNAGDPDNHVLAGDILSPEQTLPLTEQIVAFVNGLSE